MGETPTYGLPYPDAAAHTRTWEHWQAQAEAIDALLPKIVQAGTVTITGGTGTASVVFDYPFAVAPVIVIGVQTGTTVETGNICWASSVTTTGFEAQNNRGNTTNTTLQWVAVGVPA